MQACKALIKNLRLVQRTGDFGLLSKVIKDLELKGIFAKVYISPEGKVFREHVMWIIKQQKYHNVGQQELLGRRLKAYIFVYPPDRRERDMDNLPKCIFDAFQHGGLVKNDSQIKKFTVEEKSIVKGGAVKVVIETM